jgi:hypothetical protein
MYVLLCTYRYIINGANMSIRTNRLRKYAVYGEDTLIDKGTYSCENDVQNGQGWKWPCSVRRLITFICFKYEISEKYLFLLLDVLFENCLFSYKKNVCFFINGLMFF